MTDDQIRHAIQAIQLAIENGGAIDMILAHGNSRSCRDVPMGLDAEGSLQVWGAIKSALADKLG